MGGRQGRQGRARGQRAVPTIATTPRIEERPLTGKFDNRKSQAVRPRPAGRKNASSALVVGAVAMIALAAAWVFVSSQSGATASPKAGSPGAGTSISTETASPTPRFVRSIILVASIGEPKGSTPAGLTWTGIQAAAAHIGATTSNVVPASNAELAGDLDQAAMAQSAVVVTVGSTADAAVQAAAAAHPTTQFLEMDVVVPDTSPPNVHGLAFDEAEAGYLAGYVAAAFSGSGKVGMVGDAQTDVHSTNYGAGFRNGAAEAVPAIAVALAYAGTPDSPDRGRTAAAGLVKGGNDVILAMPSLSGIGAMRETCARKARLVAVDADAWQVVPDVDSCLIVSVMKRYDAAVTAAIGTASKGTALPRVTVNDVANGGIALSAFHADLPEGFQARLDAVVSTLRSGPPRPTTAPPSGPPSAVPSGSPKP